MNIRASMLPGLQDCCRRAVAKQYRKKFQKIGYEFREIRPSVGSAAGTAVHAGGEEFLKARWRGGESPTVAQLAEIAIEGFREEVSHGCEWDDTSPGRDTAEFQIQRMIAAYVYGPARNQIPLTVNDAPAVELHLEADAGDGWKLTGTMDLLESEDAISGNVHDTKTGSVLRPYDAQLGSYSLLVRSNGLLKTVKGCCIDFIKRCRKTKPQDEPVQVWYPVALVERVAMGTIRRLKRDMFLFDSEAEKMKGDIQGINLDECFPTNRMSMMCSPRFCPAFGTGFCPATKSQ